MSRLPTNGDILRGGGKIFTLAQRHTGAGFGKSVSPGVSEVADNYTAVTSLPLDLPPHSPNDSSRRTSPRK